MRTRVDIKAFVRELVTLKDFTSYAHLTASQDKLTIAGFAGDDLGQQVSYQNSIPATTGEAGEARFAIEPIWRSLQDMSGELLIELDEAATPQKLHMACDPFRAALPPAILAPRALPDGQEFVSVRLSVLAELMSKVSFATDLHSVVHGVLMEYGPHGVRLIATDGRILAVAEGGTQGPAETVGWQWPVMHIKQLKRLHLSSSAETVSLQKSDHALKAVSGDCTLCISPVATSFPWTWKRIVEQERPKSGVASREELFAAIDRVSRNGEDARVELRLEPDQIVLDAGWAKERIPAEVTGEGAIAFTGTYLKLALDSMADGKVTIRFGDSGPMLAEQANHRIVITSRK